jgi:uncharacterized RDD family membrane protein YckC
MKCPKCGYLGFETTDRCRNCQYDFSLAPFRTEAELTLQDGSRATESPLDLELPPLVRPSDAPDPSVLDLDRLFGDPEPGAAAQPPAVSSEPPTISVLEERPEDPEEQPEDIETVPEAPVLEIDVNSDPVHESDLSMLLEDYATDAPAPVEPVAAPAPEVVEPALGRAPEVTDLPEPERGPELVEPEAVAASAKTALPFEESPIVPPPARPPLAVRRTTPEAPRNRPRMTRPIRSVSLDFESTRAEEATRAAGETVALLMEPPSLVIRIGAGLIDTLLLLGIDAVVVYLTLRVTGLQNTIEDLRVLPPVPFVGFLSLLTYGYIAAFTVAGGQTIGKMTLHLRVIGDDGRRVDAAGGMIRALGCMLVPLTLGLSYLPALFTSDRRALHDRLAGTRVVGE